MGREDMETIYTVLSGSFAVTRINGAAIRGKSEVKKDFYDANAVDGESKINHDDINTNPV